MEFIISGGHANAKISVVNEREKNGIYYADVKFSLDTPEVPEKFTVMWKEPILDCYSTWSPSIKHDRNLGPNWRANKTNSRVAEYMPVQSIVSAEGRNRMTFSLSDAFNPTQLSSGVCEEDACFDVKVNFFTVPVAPLKDYSCTLRIDRRDIPYWPPGSPAF